MKSESIKALLADPNIDPTEWVGKALLGWVASNPLIVLSDPHARKYLFEGMDLNDAKILVKGVCEQYKESDDPKIIRNFVNALNPVARSAARRGDYSTSWTHSVITMALQGCVDANTIDALVNIEAPEHDSNEPPASFWGHIRPDHIKKLIANRKPNWRAKTWEKMLGMIPREELFEYTISTLIPVHLNRRVDDSCYPYKLHKILWTIFGRLPEEHARGWMELLEKTDFSKCWGGYAWEKVSKKKRDPEIRLNGHVCGCGVVAASKSGLSLHQNGCGKSKVSLYKAARILVAQTDPLMCRKCGRSCKTSSGLTLHEKKCKSENVDYVLNLRKEVLEKEMENAYITENPVSGQTDQNVSGLTSGV